MHAVLLCCRPAVPAVKSTQAEAHLLDSATQHGAGCVQFARSRGGSRGDGSLMRVLQRAADAVAAALHLRGAVRSERGRGCGQRTREATKQKVSSVGIEMYSCTRHGGPGPPLKFKFYYY